MKNILDFLKESVDPEGMRNYIINTLSVKDFYQMLSDKSLAKAYNIIAKETGGFPTMIEPTRELVEAYAIPRNIKRTIITNIIRTFKVYDEESILNHLINNQLYLPTADQVFQSDSGDLIDYFSNYTFKSKIDNSEYKLSKDILGELATIHTQGIGHFEVICDLFIDDIITASAGDVVSKNSGVYELKCNGGRVMPKNILDAQTICDTYTNLFNQLIGKDPKNKDKDPSGYFHDGRSLNKQFDELKEYYMDGIITIDNIVELFCHSYLSQYGNDNFIKKYLSDAKKFVLDKKIITESENDIKINTSLFERFIGCEQLYFYHEIDNWDYIIVITANMKNQVALNGKYKKLPGTLLKGNFYSSLNNIWNIKEIKFSDWPYHGNTTTGQNNAVKIHYKK